MKTVSVIFHSGTGHTKKMAEAVAKGAGSASDTKVELLEIKNEDIKDGRYKNDSIFETLDKSDAIIFGSPTYMGNVSGQFKCFADATAERWMPQKWAGKVAGGFTVSSSPSGDKLFTLMYFNILAAQHSMITVGLDIVPYGDKQGRNKLGSFLGAMGLAGQEDPEVAPNEADKLTGEALGKRVAEMTARLK